MAQNGEVPRGGPWTRHGHAVPGVTLPGPGRPPVAHCGGPGMCVRCRWDAAELRQAARRADEATERAREAPATYRLVLGPPENLLYDPEHGVLQTFIDGEVREQVRVRAELADRALRMVIVEELRLLGYTVTEP
jgi:hypothetical protein